MHAVSSGTTAALSGIVFQRWFDIITMMTSTNLVVCTRGNVQEPQLYHHILGDEFDQITSLMLEATCLWGMSVKIIIVPVGSFIIFEIEGKAV